MPRKGENIYIRKDGRWEGRDDGHYEKVDGQTTGLEQNSRSTVHLF